MSYFVEDFFMKIAIPEFLNVLFEFLNIVELGKSINPLPTELKFDLKQYRLDYVCETDMDFIVNVEFQSTYLGKKDLVRIITYALLLFLKYKKPVASIVISSFEKEDKIIYYNFGVKGKYGIQVISLKEFDGWKILNELKEKILNNEKFNRENILLLVLLPYMEDKIYAEKLLRGAVKIYKKMNATKKEKAKVSVCIILSIERFIKDEKIKKELIGEMKMGKHIIYEFFEPDIDEKIGKRIEKGREEGKEEGREEGREETKDNIVDYMIQNDFTMDQINNIKNLDLSNFSK